MTSFSEVFYIINGTFGIFSFVYKFYRRLPNSPDDCRRGGRMNGMRVFIIFNSSVQQCFYYNFTKIVLVNLNTHCEH